MLLLRRALGAWAVSGVAYAFAEPQKIPCQPGRDPFAWLRDDSRSDPAVLGVLERENDFAGAALAGMAPLAAAVEQQLDATRAGESETPPTRVGGFEYVRRSEKGRWPVHVRLASAEGAEEDVVVFDEASLYVDHPADAYYYCSEVVPDPTGRRVAVCVDTTGDEQYRVHVLRVCDGVEEEATVSDTTGNVTWQDDGEALLFVRRDQVHRPATVWRLPLDRGAEEEELVFSETDPEFSVSLTPKYVISASYTASETRSLSGDVLHARQPGVWAAVDGDWALVNGASLTFEGREVWRAKEGQEAEALVALEDGSGAVLLLRSGGAMSLLHAPSNVELLRDTPALALLGPGAAPDSVRVMRGALHRPSEVLDLSVASNSETRLWCDGEASDSYCSEQLVTESGVPVSLFYRPDRVWRGSRPTWLSVYGAYGLHLDDPWFDRRWTVLADMGIVVAIAHVRGGGRLGSAWHDAARGVRKEQTFDDVIAVAETLVETGRTSPRQLLLHGTSAGGLAAAVCATRRPDLFVGVVAEVPFVDVLTSMRDESIPLVALERTEWGDPLADPDVEAAQKRYAPYETVRFGSEAVYPHLLVTAGLHDFRVAVWEPLKWVAKMRLFAVPGSGQLLLQTDMGGGHFAAAGGAHKQLAAQVGFFLWCMMHAPAPPPSPSQSEFKRVS